jgi:hypothetical protein
VLIIFIGLKKVIKIQANLRRNLISFQNAWVSILSAGNIAAFSCALLKRYGTVTSTGPYGIY